MEDILDGAKRGTATPSLVRIRFAHLPTHASIKQGELVIWESSPDVSSATSEVSIPLELPKEGIEILAAATWPPNTPDTAVTIEIEPEGLDTKSDTHWSVGPDLSQIYSFTW